MRRMLIVAAVLATAATVAAVAAARPVSAKQSVSIEQKGSSFVLTPNSSGAIQPDKGAFAACCWTTRNIVVAGERLEINDPHLTLTGADGTLKLRNRIRWIDVPGGLGIFTGTWKVVGGTGVYAGLSGGGRVAGVQTAGGYARAKLFGFLGPK
jgi:hypothetical protein